MDNQAGSKEEVEGSAFHPFLFILELAVYLILSEISSSMFLYIEWKSNIGIFIHIIADSGRVT